MSRYIETSEATAVIADYFDLICDTEYRFNESDILRRLNNSAVDAVPVIRCKDCKYYVINELKKDGTEDRRYSPSVCIARLRAVEHGPDWYCADAERRGEE